MRKHLQGIDHVVMAVHDLDRAGASYRRFGFTLTPKGRHTTGSENHCVMFGHDYFELLGVPVPHPVNRYYQDFLAQGEGLAAIALATDDARGFHDELVAGGIPVAEPVDFSRPVQLANGTFDASFRITQIEPQATPAGRVFACQHFTRDLVWRPEYRQHANEVQALAGVIAVAEAAGVQKVAERYAAIFAVAPQAGSIGDQPRYDVATGDTPLTFTTAGGLAQLFPGVAGPLRTPPSFAALCFRTASLDVARDVLRSNGVPCIAVPHGIAVPAEEAHGVALVFSE